MKTTFYTCCNKEYEDFIPIFIHSAVFHNEDIDIEIGVKELDQIKEIQKSVEYIKINYPNKIKINKIKTPDKITKNNKVYGVCPNVIRFIEMPELKNDYVYICDIDIITLQKDITQIHLDDMEKTGLNYSNIVRPNQKKLSGLHFTKWNNYYPIPDFDDLLVKGMLNHDEVFLYNLLIKNNVISETNTFRPIHGIHISPNRTELGSINGWRNQWENYRRSEEFLFLEKLFSVRILNFIKKIDEEIK